MGPSIFLIMSLIEIKYLIYSGKVNFSESLTISPAVYKAL